MKWKPASDAKRAAKNHTEGWFSRWLQGQAFIKEADTWIFSSMPRRCGNCQNKFCIIRRLPIFPKTQKKGPQASLMPADIDTSEPSRILPPASRRRILWRNLPWCTKAPRQIPLPYRHTLPAIARTG